uniref:ORF58d n=1 Tax=Pinus koraiensis TaxID=88728 RepID=Q85WY7_PINKO|nr:ORF58d [Pinus koraiensis]AAO74082.1 ORF58d [Pinus koraiensis]
MGFAVNPIGCFRSRKLIIQTALRGRTFPIDIGAFGPERIVSPIMTPLGCRIYILSPFL